MLNDSMNYALMTSGQRAYEAKLDIRSNLHGKRSEMKKKVRKKRKELLAVETKRQLKRMNLSLNKILLSFDESNQRHFQFRIQVKDL